MNLNSRNKRAIRTVLEQMGETTFRDIARRAGDGLASSVMEMVRDGEVDRVWVNNDSPVTYRLKARGVFGTRSMRQSRASGVEREFQFYRDTDGKPWMTIKSNEGKGEDFSFTEDEFAQLIKAEAGI